MGEADGSEEGVAVGPKEGFDEGNGVGLITKHSDRQCQITVNLYGLELTKNLVNNIY